jgi:putative cell wall-binding protein
VVAALFATVLAAGVVAAVPADAASSTQECLSRSSGDTTTRSGTLDGLRETRPDDGHTFDLRSTTVLGNQDRDSSDYNPTPLNLGTDSLPADMCVIGGLVRGTHDRDLDWEYLKHDPGGGDRPALRVGGQTTIDGLRVTNMMNGLRPFSDHTTVRNAYFEHIRDDCVANDSLHSMRIVDSYFDGCYTAFSARPEKGSDLWDKGRDTSLTEIDRTLIRLKPMPGGFKIDDPSVSSYDHLWKWSNVSGPVIIRDSIIMVEENGVNNHVDWPDNVTAKNVTIVWAGDGDYPGDVPDGATLTRDTSVWERATNDWLARHGCTDVTHCDPNTLTNPDGDPARISGPDRIGTSVAVSGAAFDRAGTAVIASAHAFPDALAATQLADAVDGPVLLSDRGGLDARVARELDRLGVSDVVVAGGVAAMSNAVVRDLDEAGFDVQRVGGGTRYETAAAVARAALEHRGVGTAKRVLVATGEDFPDALAAGPLAGHADLPLVLAAPGAGPDSPAARFLDEVGAREVTLLGGTIPLPDSLAATLGRGREVSRIAGGDRFETARRLTEAAVRAGGSPGDVLVATGSDFPDALSAAPAALARGGVIVLTAPDGVPAPTRNWLQGVDDWSTWNVVGGRLAVGPDVIRDLRAAAGL